MRDKRALPVEDRDIDGDAAGERRQRGLAGLRRTQFVHISAVCPDRPDYLCPVISNLLILQYLMHSNSVLGHHHSKERIENRSSGFLITI